MPLNDKATFLVRRSRLIAATRTLARPGSITQTRHHAAGQVGSLKVMGPAGDISFGRHRLRQCLSGAAQPLLGAADGASQLHFFRMMLLHRRAPCHSQYHSIFGQLGRLTMLGRNNLGSRLLVDGPARITVGRYLHL
jgi:hypothetical protein